MDPYAAANVTTADFLAYEVIALVWFAHFATGLQVPDVSAAEYESFGNVVSPASLMRTAEMRGYRFLISASYPYPLKTIRIRILSVQTLTAVRILSVSVLLTVIPKKISPPFSTVDSKLVVRF